VGVTLQPRRPATLVVRRRDGRRDEVALVIRIDTPIEAAYFSAGGILPYMLEQLLAGGAVGSRPSASDSAARSAS
jgi:aconitate hydratase